MHDLILRGGTLRDGSGPPGRTADVCVFDPAAIRHDGTYDEPGIRPAGVIHVLLGGRMVIDGGEFTGGGHGRLLRRGGGCLQRREAG
ncbi:MULTISPECIES: hypothetical protein [Streptosporangium]|uniref:N-acyl-D-aspartate/D-glutamate deacylase n=1 Tax=Streptosporangium brasiliense TaxID=47480 RepID=A0ABT9R6R6_9ACTN|nr:hypothetical protein [Streptosporangium brasiliense]MDP9864942.1 N-acyl-D-aspartate/D-glutamate deacylase [Streptosporangium brasiliense]